MTVVHPHVFLKIFGLHVHKFPHHQSCFFEIGEKVITGCVLRKGFIIDQANGDELIFADYGGQLFWGVRMAWHAYLPLQFRQVKSIRELYSLIRLYSKSVTLSN